MWDKGNGHNGKERCEFARDDPEDEGGRSKIGVVQQPEEAKTRFGDAIVFLMSVSNKHDGGRRQADSAGGDERRGGE